MALCACTPLSEVINRGCCCCCRCPCHEARLCIGTPCGALATPEADPPKKPSVPRHADPSEGLAPPQTFHASRPSSPGSAPSLCSRCAFKGAGGRTCQHHVCRCSQCCSCSCSVPPAGLLDALLESHPFLSYLPIVDERTDEERLADAITASGYPGKYVIGEAELHCCRYGTH